MVLALILATSNLLILRYAVGHIVGVLLTHAFRKVFNHTEIALVEVLRMQLEIGGFRRNVNCNREHQNF